MKGKVPTPLYIINCIPQGISMRNFSTKMRKEDYEAPVVKEIKMELENVILLDSGGGYGDDVSGDDF